MMVFVGSSSPTEQIYTLYANHQASGTTPRHLHRTTLPGKRLWISCYNMIATLAVYLRYTCCLSMLHLLSIYSSEQQSIPSSSPSGSTFYWTPQSGGQCSSEAILRRYNDSVGASVRPLISHNHCRTSNVPCFCLQGPPWYRLLSSTGNIIETSELLLEKSLCRNGRRLLILFCWQTLNGRIRDVSVTTAVVARNLQGNLYERSFPALPRRKSG